MNIFERFINIFKFEIEEAPKAYGVYHICSFIVVILLTIFLVLKYRNCTDKKYRKILFIFWIIYLVLEILKEVSLSMNYDSTNNIVSWSYPWWFFPYQFCSTPFYVLPLVVFLKDSKVRESLIAFMTTFMLFAGLSVMFYPTDVFTTNHFLNIHTMIHHGSQVILGIFSVAYYRNKITIKYFLKSLPAFIVMAIIAILLNELFPIISNGIYMNMWFIARKLECSLPILHNIKNNTPYIIFLLIYFIGFSICSFLINLINYYSIKIFTKNKKIN